MEADNLDEIWLTIDESGYPCIENEHGTQFPIEDLSENELDIFRTNLGIPLRYDYIIVDENNKWLSYGSQKSEQDIQSEIDNLEVEKGTKIYVFVAKEFEKTELVKYGI